MKQILVYSDSLSWGIIPTTRRRLEFDARWPGVMENALNTGKKTVRVIEDCLNGRRTVWDDPFNPGRNGLVGLEQRIEIHSPLVLVILLLGTNDFQSMHALNAWHSARGMASLVNAIRRAPVEPGIPIPPVLIVAPPALQTPKGPIASKFLGGERKCIGLSKALADVAEENVCEFFDANNVTTVSQVDGVHLDADQHITLGKAIAQKVISIIPFDTLA